MKAKVEKGGTGANIHASGGETKKSAGRVKRKSALGRTKVKKEHNKCGGGIASVET